MSPKRKKSTRVSPGHLLCGLVIVTLAKFRSAVTRALSGDMNWEGVSESPCKINLAHANEDLRRD